jgi:rubrerythrin
MTVREDTQNQIDKAKAEGDLIFAHHWEIFMSNASEEMLNQEMHLYTCNICKASWWALSPYICPECGRVQN